MTEFIIKLVICRLVDAVCWLRRETECPGCDEYEVDLRIVKYES